MLPNTIAWTLTAVPQLSGNAVQAAVGDGALVHPRAEHRADGAPQLVVRVLRERCAVLFLDLGLVELDELGPVVGLELGVEHVAVPVLVLVENLLEQVMIEAEHHVGIHGDEAPVGIIGEAAVAGIAGQRLDGLVVEAEIEDGVHHARHRGAGAGAHRDEQRVVAIAEPPAGEPADLGERRLDLAPELRRIALAVPVEVGADLGGDGEAGRHRQAEIGHLGEVRALAAEEIAQPRLSFRLAVAEGIDPFAGREPRLRRRRDGFRLRDRLHRLLFRGRLCRGLARRSGGLGPGPLRRRLRRSRPREQIWPAQIWSV